MSTPTPRVLIADDETLIRLDIRALLESEGLTVCGEARDGREAVALARELQPDVIVLDVKMPGLDGIEATKQILAEQAIPIVMLTAYGYGELIMRALDAGVATHISKPFRAEHLVEAVKNALGTTMR